MVISFMIKRICLFTRSWNLFSIMSSCYSWIHTRHIKRKALPRTFSESLQLRGCFIKLGMFYKICKSKSKQNLFKFILEKTSSYVRRNAGNIPLFNIRRIFYKNSFFPSTAILRFIRLKRKKVF